MRQREIHPHPVERAHDLSALGFFQQAGFQQGMHVAERRGQVLQKHIGETINNPDKF